MHVRSLYRLYSCCCARLDLRPAGVQPILGCGDMYLIKGASSSGKEKRVAYCCERLGALLVQLLGSMFNPVLPSPVVVQADGGEFAAAVCAASAALADAGIELTDMLPACSVVSRHAVPWACSHYWLLPL